MQEARSQGLQLIITPNTRGSVLLKEGQIGFLVPIRSSEILGEKILWFVNNRSELPQMRRNAQIMQLIIYGKTIAQQLPMR